MDLTDEFLDNLPGSDRQDEQAVIICLQFPPGKFRSKAAVNAIFDLDNILQTIIETSQVGMYDGNEFREGPNEELVTFFIYGPDANRIYREIQPILTALPDLPGSYIIKRYSNLDKGEEHVSL